MARSLYYRQILFLILLFVAFFIVIGILIYTGTSSAAIVNPEAASPGKKKLFQYERTDVVISEDEQYEGDVLIERSDLKIGGVIFGDVYAKHSSIHIMPNARIFGNIYAYETDITKEDLSKLAGDIVNFSSTNSLRVERTEYREIPGFKFPYDIIQAETVINQDETRTGDVIVFEQKLTINGKIDGDLIAFNADLVLSNSAAIDGHVIYIGGQLDMSGNPLVTGTIYPPIEKVEEETVVEAPKPEDDKEIQREVEKKYLEKDKRQYNDDVVRFFGDVTIEEDEVINGDVVCMRGTIKLLGEVHGDVVAIFGNVDMDSTSTVTGDVVSVGGHITRDEGARVGGDIVQTSWTGVKVEEDDQHIEAGLSGVKIGPKDGRNWRDHKSDYRWHHEYDDINDEPFMLRYNRVEGLFIGYEIPEHTGWDNDRHSQLYGHIGYGFKTGEPRYQIGMNRWIFNTFRFTIGGEYHDITDTEDYWVIPTVENSLAAFFLKEDFQDFYRCVGASGYIIQNITPHFRIKAGYHKDEFYSMDKHDIWSLFGGDKVYRPNPAIDELEYKSVRAEIGLDTRNDFDGPTQGWLIQLVGEFANNDLNDNGVDFDRYILDIRRFQPIGHGENLDFRVRAGSARGYLPLQYRYDLGGLSTLRGYRFKEFSDGDRMLLANLEYRIYGGMGMLEDIDILEDWNLIFFSDAGWVWNADKPNSFENGFDDLDWDSFKTSVGIGFTNYEGNVRLNIAKRLDDTNRDVVITFRVKRPF
ncbi:BamA/TamA family outer membrane protein [candidate division KSB1 bacterium]|nr:BamA/TamA family outer membrane protein [candidate division KSB1 bacterium]